ncbi:BON domain-containing protein [Paraburkholderia sp. J63]|uniref:BON domain-containing protein n=1 Tax=Paraburkholderia sp. J63 TaxID=2805434 RepID=UPI002ABDC03C|nr:BON domain-containing protein [Paraburkholderia sp. J63]
MLLRTGIRMAAMTLLMSACASALAQGGAPAVSSQSAAAPPAVSAPTAPAAPAATAATDRQLAAAVRHALHAARKHGLKSTFIRVRARDGAVTLSGIVAAQEQIALAVSVAQGVAGVRTVMSQLQVRSDGEMKGSQ